MTKYSPETYAKAFAEVAAEVFDKGSENLIRRFLSVVRKNGDTASLRKIASKTDEFFREKRGIRKVLFEFARKPEKPPAETFGGFLKKGDVVAEGIDPELIGGIKITVDGHQQFDASLKRKIEAIFKK